MKIFAILALFLTTPLWAQYASYNGQCAKGGQAVVTQGLASTGTQPLSGSPTSTGTGVIGSYPNCLVTVYLTGTLTQATIYSTATGGVITQPFTANNDGSFLVYGASGVGYDISMSGGGLPATVTLTDVTFGGSGGGGGSCSTGCVLTNPTGSQTITQPGSTSLNLVGTLNISTAATGIFTLFCTGTAPAVGSGIAIAAPVGCTPYTRVLDGTPSSGYSQFSFSAGILTENLEAAINLGPSSSDVGGTLDVAKGGTAATNGPAALINLFPSPLRTGDWLYWNGSQWINFGGCQTSNCFLTENGTGAPGYIQTPIPVADGGTGDLTLSAGCVLQGNGTSPIGCSAINSTSTLVTVTAGRILLSGSVPTCVFTSGGGSSPSCTVDTGSTDSGGIIIATTGTGSPSTSGTITLTFSATFGTNKPDCTYTLSDNSGLWQSNATVFDGTPSTSSDILKWQNGTVTALTTSTAYWINYHCYAK